MDESCRDSFSVLRKGRPTVLTREIRLLCSSWSADYYNIDNKYQYTVIDGNVDFFVGRARITELKQTNKLYNRGECQAQVKGVRKIRRR